MMYNKTGTSLYLLPFESCSVAVETLKDRIQAGCNWQTWSDKGADVAGSRSVGLWWIQMMMMPLNWGLWPP
ncbi:hypothetical protein F2Q69_00001360 [Brassica cretica]|uniref:Uncharacterized protein n=1 Tax=Brassica cretica TaxID=69181 RepID=A0A8S9NWS6_BRACR|nr:hypothetical protein F2Q69_00001360 [Brassica cretica]